MADLAGATERSVGQVAAAVRTLMADGLVHAGPAALRGRPGGRVRLAE
jgi:hypothetical protein